MTLAGRVVDPLSQVSIQIIRFGVSAMRRGGRELMSNTRFRSTQRPDRLDPRAHGVATGHFRVGHGAHRDLSVAVLTIIGLRDHEVELSRVNGWLNGSRSRLVAESRDALNERQHAESQLSHSIKQVKAEMCLRG